MTRARAVGEKTLSDAVGLHTDPSSGKLRIRRYVVTVVTGVDAGRRAELDGGTFLIGTNRTTDLRLTDKRVSRHHLELHAHAEGLRVTDLDSSYGTFRVDADGETKIGSITLATTQGDKARFRLGPDTAIEITPREASLPTSGWEAETFGRLVGGSKPMRDLFGMLAQVAHSNVTVLLEGETGTGKELVAEAIHHYSPRKDAPFVVVDCGSLSRELIGSELFGHVRGAFTGADENKRGLIEEAEGGTLFLDEIGELPRDLQPHLLRALEKREIRRIGDVRSRRVDVRMVAATNRVLAERVREGAFREDLYFRLAVVRVTVPSLREHKRDIPRLVRAFARELGKQDFSPPQHMLAQLMAHDWPGNVRELRNVVERGLSLAADALDIEVDAGAVGRLTGDDTQRRPAREELLVMSFKDAKNVLTESFEREYLTQLLARHHGNVTRAAADAGIDRNHMHKLIRRHQLPIDRE